ncbi:hypothetical protein BDR26DRAFT_856797 [Obelidium mucronatum]|nr:hypothetical protein BDR26DRAFT_856797 [Obelidium mucronatum]
MAAGDLDRACLCKFCDGVLLKDPTSVQWIEYEGKEEELDEEEENGGKEGTKEQEGQEQEDGSNLSTKDETSLEATSHMSANLQLGIELAAAEEDNVSMQEATTRLGSEADPMFPSLLSMDSNFTGINAIINDTPLATIDPAQLFMPPTTTGASPDKDWNGSDYDSENDGSYATSSDNSSSDDEKSDSSGSDNDLVDDDDDDDSGNEQEPEDPETNGDESQEDDEMEKESLFPDLENFNTKFRKSHLKKTQKSSSSSSNLIILNAQELSKSYIPCRKGEPVWYPSSHLNFQPPPKAGSRFNQEMPFGPALWNRGVIQAVGVSSSWEPIPSFPVHQRPVKQSDGVLKSSPSVTLSTASSHVHLLPRTFVVAATRGGKWAVLMMVVVVVVVVKEVVVMTLSQKFFLVDARDSAVSPHVDGTPQLPKTNMELEEVGDGFGQVGLVVGEARNVWDSWVSFDGKGEDEGQGGLGTFVEVVRGLENQVVCFPNMGDLYDFNYEEQSSDEGGNEENEEEEEEDLVLDRRSVRVTATEAANLESSGDDDDYLTVELD